ncbi:hypothetical protein ACJ41O_009500 [Fusarium nematophilum]
MSDGSFSDDDVDYIDLNQGDDDTPEPEHDDADNDEGLHFFDGFDDHGDPVIAEMPNPEDEDPMDVDEAPPGIGDEVPAGGDEGSLFVQGNMTPPSSPADGASDDGDTDEDESDESDGTESEADTANGGNANGGDPDDDDPDDDGSGGDDSDDSDDFDDADLDDPRFENMNPNAELVEALQEEGITAPAWRHECLMTCKPPWDEVARAFQFYRKRFLDAKQGLRMARAANRRRIATLREANRALRARLPGPRKTRPTWRRIVRRWICDHERAPGIFNWGDVYKQSCKEENISWAFGPGKPPKTHPYLTLRSPTQEEEAAAIVAAGNNQTSEGQERRAQPPGQENTSSFEWDRLPLAAQVKILQHALVFEGKVVHAISRLDPYYEPSEVPRNCSGRISLLHRFHIGRRSVSLTFSALKPENLLAPLLGRFARGIKNRLQHMQHMAILWIGSQWLTYKPDAKNKYTSRRTHLLGYLGEARRLKDIAIHLPESSKGYMRRKHEPEHIIAYLADKTKKQPNFRRCRSLRTLQGLDYLHMLRGLREITFWDYDQWRQKSEKVPVRDWTFLRDINDVVRREKDPKDHHFAQLKKLAPLISGYRVPHADIVALERVIGRRPENPAGVPLSPPPDGQFQYPLTQSAVELSDGEVDTDSGSDSGSGDSDSGSGSSGDEESDDDSGSEGGDGDAGLGDDSDHDSDDDDDDDEGGDLGVGGPGGSSPEGNGSRSSSDGDASLATMLQEAINRPSEEQEEQKYDPRADHSPWSFNGAVIDLTRDEEPQEPQEPASTEPVNSRPVSPDTAAMPPPARVPSHRPSRSPEGQGEVDAREASLFVRSPEREARPVFVTKVESPSPPRSSHSASAPPQAETRVTPTPQRQIREESSLYCSPTRYRDLVPPPSRESTRERSIVDLTGSTNENAPPARAHSSTWYRSDRNKRSRSKSDEGGDDEDVRFIRSGPKRPRPDDGNSGGAAGMEIA